LSLRAFAAPPHGGSCSGPVKPVPHKVLAEVALVQA